MTTGPVAFPEIRTPAAPTVSGASVVGTTAGVTTFEAEDPPGTAVSDRRCRPWWLFGTAGVLRWSVRVAPGGPMVARPQVVFLDMDGDVVGRTTGLDRSFSAPVVVSIRVPVPESAYTASLRLVSTAGNAGMAWTEQSVRLDQVPNLESYVPPGRLPDFGESSVNGVAPPAPSAGLPDGEALSPARRSPQVRWAQRIDSARPDLLPKRNALEV